MDIRNIKIKKETKFGRTYSLLVEEKNGHSKTLWTGSGSKVLETQVDLIWKVLCEQQAQIEELEAKLRVLDNPNLVLLEPVQD